MIEYNMLTDTQKDYADKIYSHLINAVENNPDDYKERLVTLSGSAGSGKSTTTAVIVKMLSEYTRRGSPLRIKITSPTHKALGVLRDMVKIIGCNNIPVSTIHSHLALKLTEDYKTGTYVLTKDRTKNIERFDIILLDEASMVGDDLWEYLIESIDMGYIKGVLFVGDGCQLLPVSGEPIDIFKPDNKFTVTHNLTKVVRQAEGNPIISFANKVRHHIQENIDNQTPYPEFKVIKEYLKEFMDGEHIIGFNNESAFREHYENSHSSEFESLSVAYTNKKVDMLNNSARKFFKGKDTAYLVENDILVFQESYEENGMPLFQNNEVVKIKQCLKTYDDVLQIYYWDCLDFQSRYFRVVDKKSLPDFQYELEQVANKAKKAKGIDRTAYWREFFDLKKRFASVSYHYACSIHKSQGSSINDIYIDINEIAYYENKADADSLFRLIYVGCTRCKNRLIYKS